MSGPGFAAARRRHILGLVRRNGWMALCDLVTALGGSDMTVRRDLRVLAGQGPLVRARGGALPERY